MKTKKTEPGLKLNHQAPWFVINVGAEFSFASSPKIRLIKMSETAYRNIANTVAYEMDTNAGDSIFNCNSEQLLYLSQPWLMAEGTTLCWCCKKMRPFEFQVNEQLMIIRDRCTKCLATTDATEPYAPFDQHVLAISNYKKELPAVKPEITTTHAVKPKKAAKQVLKPYQKFNEYGVCEHPLAIFQVISRGTRLYCIWLAQNGHLWGFSSSYKIGIGGGGSLPWEGSCTFASRELAEIEAVKEAYEFINDYGDGGDKEKKIILKELDNFKAQKHIVVPEAKPEPTAIAGKSKTSASRPGTKNKVSDPAQPKPTVLDRKKQLNDFGTERYKLGLPQHSTWQWQDLVKILKYRNQLQELNNKDTPRETVTTWNGLMTMKYEDAAKWERIAKQSNEVNKLYVKDGYVILPPSHEHKLERKVSTADIYFCRACNREHYEVKKFPHKCGCGEMVTAVDKEGETTQTGARVELKPTLPAAKAVATYGGKNGAGTYQEIINQFPPHNHYIELCLRSGAILCRKKPAAFNTGVEIDAAVIKRYKYPAHAQIVCADLFTFVKENPDLFSYSNTLVYIDPPYPLDSRKQQKLIYDFEFTDQMHHQLCELIKTFKCMVAISTYENDIYKQHLGQWRTHTFSSQTRNGPAQEMLYMNYPTPTALHEYTYMGKNATHRQMLKRKVNRWVGKLKALPVLERSAIMDAINNLK